MTSCDQFRLLLGIVNSTDIPWILKINQIHQNIPHFEYFPKREPHPKCTAAIHPISPPNGCEKGGINNYQYTVDLKYLISKLVTNVKCTQLQGVLRLMMYFIYRTHHPQMVRAVMNWHSYDDWLKNHHNDWLQNMIDYMSTIDKLMTDYKIMIDYM